MPPPLEIMNARRRAVARRGRDPRPKASWPLLVVHSAVSLPRDRQHSEPSEGLCGLIVLVFGVGEGVLLGLSQTPEGVVEVGEALENIALLGEDDIEGVDGGVVFGGGHMGEGHMNKILWGVALSKLFSTFFGEHLFTLLPAVIGGCPPRGWSMKNMEAQLRALLFHTAASTRCGHARPNEEL